MKPLISLVLPIYNEEKNIDELYQRSQKVLPPSSAWLK
jgi:hypothetical protein